MSVTCDEPTFSCWRCGGEDRSADSGTGARLPSRQIVMICCVDIFSWENFQTPIVTCRRYDGSLKFSQEGCRYYYDHITVCFGVRWQNGAPVLAAVATPADREKTMAYQIFPAATTSGRRKVSSIWKFDSLISYDITYVGIIQITISSEAFLRALCERPTATTACAVGGTINEDDHVFGLSAATGMAATCPCQPGRHPPVCPEMMSGCGRMILGSDSYTRYGAIGTMASGEGGPEIGQGRLLENTYIASRPRWCWFILTGTPGPGRRPPRRAIAPCGQVYKTAL